MRKLDRSIENVSHISKKGVKDIFNNVIKNVILDEKDCEFHSYNRKEDYKQLLKFIDILYMSVSSVYEKNVLSKLDDYSYERVKDKFAEACRNISYNNFDLWIRNNKNHFSLYNINAKTIEDKYLQIAFYEDMKQIMYYVYEALNYDNKIEKSINDCKKILKC